MAKVEFDAWNGYLQSRNEDVANLPDKEAVIDADIDLLKKYHEGEYSHQIPVHEMSKLKEFFDRFKVSVIFKF